jgi:hypothetical protein
LQSALNALGQVIFVDSYALGLNNGTSWPNAFRELQDALHLAGPGARILVSEGYYWPDWDPLAHVITGDRAATFSLKNGVTLIGGYPHGGGARDVLAHPSILTGDITSSDLWDNSFHVVTAGASIDESAVLDGFVVWEGLADGAYPNDRGGGMLLAGGSPVVRHTRVLWNAGHIAGGIFNENGSPSFQDVAISFNAAISGGGGGMWNQGGDRA